MITDLPAWRRIPTMECKGLCTDSCSMVEASQMERAILRRHGFDLPPITEALTAYLRDGDYTCPLLKDGRCQAYSVRPTVCRSWGAVEGMPCPHGCVPKDGLLPDAIAREALASTYRPGELEAMGADEEVAALVKTLRERRK